MKVSLYGKVVDLYPCDAGTDSGTDYSSINSATNQAQVIYRITCDPFINNQSLANLGTFTFTRLQNLIYRPQLSPAIELNRKEHTLDIFF